MANNFIPGRGLGHASQHKGLVFGLGDWTSTRAMTTLGLWHITGLTSGDVQTSMQLRERKVVSDAKVPRAEFDQTTYPNMPIDNVGISIPIGFGVVRGAKAILIDSQTKRFKFLGHSIITADGFFDGNGDEFTPDTIDVSGGEFTYLAWDGNTGLFVDYTTDTDNPVDVAKMLLIDPVRGIELSESELDTASAGKGFGIYGARLDYIRGTIPSTGAEVCLYPIGLHISEPTRVKDILNTIQAVAFAFIFVDFEDKWQFKPWKPVVGEGLEVVTEKMIIGQLKPSIKTIDAATKCVVKYNKRISTDTFQRAVATNEQLRQLRGAPAHELIEKELPISAKFGADDWAEKTVGMRGRAQRVHVFNATSEMKLAEPGDYRRLAYSPRNVNEIVMITSNTRRMGETAVSIEAIDNFGLRSKVGIWTEAGPLTFPSALGGGTFADWDDADTAAKKQYVRENWAIWLNDNGYADELDPLESFELNLWE